MNGVLRFSLGSVWFFAIAGCAGVLAADRPPEMVDDATAKAVWEKLVASTEDLDVFSQAKLISRVPAIAPCRGASPMAAATADVVCFWDRRENGYGRGSNAWFEAERDVFGPLGGNPLARVEPAEVTRVRKAIGEECLKELFGEEDPRSHVDARGFTPGQEVARWLQRRLDRSNGEAAGDRLRNAVLYCMKSWYFLVSVSCERASAGRCRQSISHDMPFVCLFGDAKNPRPYACFGYAEGSGKSYWIALDPTKCKVCAEPLGLDGSRALSSVPASPRATTGSFAMPPHDYDTEARPTAVPGVVVLEADRSTFTCIFVSDWRADTKTMIERVKRIRGKMSAKPINKEAKP